MSQGHRPLKTRMLDRLVAANGWVVPQVLVEGLSTSPVAIEDALADLVVEQLAEFMPAAGYRFKATYLCRQAARQLVQSDDRRVVLARPDGNTFRVGVAQRMASGLMVYELEMPLPPAGAQHLPQHQQQVDLILKLTTQGT